MSEVYRKVDQWNFILVRKKGGSAADWEVYSATTDPSVHRQFVKHALDTGEPMEIVPIEAGQLEHMITLRKFREDE